MKILPLLLFLTACSQQVITKTEFIKYKITDPGDPVPTAQCSRSNYVLLEYMGKKMVAETIEEKLAKLECNRDKLRYVNELKNTITYYREVTK